MRVVLEPCQVGGFRFAGVAAGIKTNAALDLGLICADTTATAAGVFTRNLVRAAPVVLSARRIAARSARAVLVNSGNANACTGQPGADAALATTGAVAQQLDVGADDVLCASTGVIGKPLPTDVIASATPGLVDDLSDDGAARFAEAIRTTDRFAKVASVEVESGGQRARFMGIGKGAGMIHPDLGPLTPHATMLVFLVTDAVVDSAQLQHRLVSACDVTFNACTVDGDTSTNDTVLALASGSSGWTPDPKLVQDAFTAIGRELALMMVADGEGAEHAVEIAVSGLASDADARQVARTVALSPLVKTALFGRDANWGRLLAAAGRAGPLFDPQRATIRVGGITIAERGAFVSAEAEASAAKVMQDERYRIDLELGDGPGSFSYFTSDLGHGYIDVNAGYRS